MFRSFKNILVASLLLPLTSTAQHNTTQSVKPTQQTTISQGYFLGIGTGLDYGGLGLKLEATPMPLLGLFLGVGTNFNGPGINAGISVKPFPLAKFAPVAQAMYGYNAVILVKKMNNLNKTYYGPSVGLGFDWYVGKANNKLFFGIYAPIRSSKFQKDYDAIKAIPGIEGGDITPFTLSLGFNWRLPV